MHCSLFKSLFNFSSDIAILAYKSSRHYFCSLEVFCTKVVNKKINVLCLSKFTADTTLLCILFQRVLCMVILFLPCFYGNACFLSISQVNINWIPQNVLNKTLNDFFFLLISPSNIDFKSSLSTQNTAKFQNL